jgi:formate dehydrogenase subunit delta
MPAKQVEHLVKMANQISLNMAAWGDEEEVARKTAEHLKKFWTRDMCVQLLECWREGKAALSPAAERALRNIEAEF